MDSAVNTRPLLQQSSDSDFEDDIGLDRSAENLNNDVLVVTTDSKPLFKSREPHDRSVNKLIDEPSLHPIKLPGYVLNLFCTSRLRAT